MLSLFEEPLTHSDPLPPWSLHSQSSICHQNDRFFAPFPKFAPSIWILLHNIRKKGSHLYSFTSHLVPPMQFLHLGMHIWGYSVTGCDYGVGCECILFNFSRWIVLKRTYPQTELTGMTNVKVFIAQFCNSEWRL